MKRNGKYFSAKAVKRLSFQNINAPLVSVQCKPNRLSVVLVVYYRGVLYSVDGWNTAVRFCFLDVFNTISASNLRPVNIRLIRA